MTIKRLTINKLQKEAHETAVKKGFWGKSCNIAEKIALFHSELSEALEIARCDIRIDKQINGKPEGFKYELADCIIRILDIAEYLNLDLESAIVKKMKYNKNRPRLHGKKF